MPTVIHWLAARQYQTDAQLVINVEQIGLGVACDLTTDGGDGGFCAGNDLRVHLTQPLVQRDPLLITVRAITNHLIGACQGSETRAVGGGPRHVCRLIDQHA